MVLVWAASQHWKRCTGSGAERHTLPQVPHWRWQAPSGFAVGYPNGLRTMPPTSWGQFLKISDNVWNPLLPGALYTCWISGGCCYWYWQEGTYTEHLLIASVAQVLSSWASQQMWSCFTNEEVEAQRLGKMGHGHTARKRQRSKVPDSKFIHFLTHHLFPQRK